MPEKSWLNNYFLKSANGRNWNTLHMADGDQIKAAIKIHVPVVVRDLVIRH